MLDPSLTGSTQETAKSGRTAQLKGAMLTAGQRVGSGKQRFDATLCGRIWGRLGQLEFIDHALLLAGTMTLWLIPSLIVLDRVRGESAARTISHTMGLTHEAATHLAH